MRFLRNEPLKKHTSFKIGGPADYFCVPKNIDELCQALIFAKERSLAITILGAGSNLLVLDKGFRGLVIKLAGMQNMIKFDGTVVEVGAGVRLPRLINALAKKGVGGLEFLVGIPGSVGGAVFMNAGAWGKDIGRYVLAINVIDFKGNQKVIKKNKLKFVYRGCKVANCIITSVLLRLSKKSKKAIHKKMVQYLAKRKSSQPLGVPNCGCVFRNPKGNFAGKLIEEAGGKGLRIGDAQVSLKHANFIVNLGEAKACDVIRLMTRIEKAVYTASKITLEPELKIMVKS
ncbi:MAG: UDP-N-acetylmuramate dehydrogenase [Candidatus Saganbacteria bacterium]|nr:UDP-N-acetylmuramate dehydrogenase [Candidatus Saganbacteria bacterium]